MTAFQEAHAALQPLDVRELDELIAIAAIRRDLLSESAEEEDGDNELLRVA